MELSPPIVLTILSFAFFTTSLPNQPSTTSSILSILSLCHEQPSTTPTSSANHISSTSSTNHLPKANQQPSNQKWSQSATTTSTTKSRTPATERSFSSPWHNPYDHRRFQHRFQLQVVAPRLLQRGKSRSCRMPHYIDKVVPHSYNLLCPRHQPNIIPSYRCNGAHHPHW
jgi:hypothetical protein